MKKLVLALSLTLISSTSIADVQQLPQLNIDPRAITVSGISAGADMAVQLHVAYSETFSGMGSFAGSVYGCAEGSMTRAYFNCMEMPSTIFADRYVTKAKAEARSGRIDATSNLSRSRVFIFAGANDEFVNPNSSLRIAEFYSAFMSRSKISFRKDFPSGHGIPTLNYGPNCGANKDPWLENCNYDGLGNMLQFLHNDQLSPPVKADSRQLFTFDQSRFMNANISMARKGHVYVPKACMGGTTKCSLHVALHGCGQGSDQTDVFWVHAGYNDWAEANNMVVLYPSAAITPEANPYACWDWWGYTDQQDYATKNGPQMRTIKAMVDHIAGL